MEKDRADNHLESTTVRIKEPAILHLKKVLSSISFQDFNEKKKETLKNHAYKKKILINQSQEKSSQHSNSVRNPLPYFVSLLSTGLDSPVATYLMMRQGMDCISISFLNGGDARKKNQIKILEIGQKLVELTKRNLYLLFINYDPILQQFQTQCEPRMTCLICKRTMMDIAKTVAQEIGAQFIVNGDILGEQASQTLDNLFVVHQINREVPVIRPLIGFDKLDVIKISQKVGFFPISLLEGVSCEYNPKYPETRAKIHKIEVTEKNINRPAIRKTILDNFELYHII
ncbi:hypothetical protein [Candidatus Harpocratesius sp.]